MAQATTTFSNVTRTLRIANFRYYMIGNFASQLAVWMHRIAVQWLTWELTHSPLWLGIVAFADFIPNVILAPLAGALTDRTNHIRALKIYISLSACMSAAMAILIATGLINVHILVLLILINGVILALNMPIRLAIIHRLVDRDNLTSAIAISSLGFNGARILGPAIAGLLIWASGVAAALWAIVIADIVFVLSLYWIKLAAAEAEKKRRTVSQLPSEILEGFRYAARHAGIAPLLVILITSTILARPFIDLLAGFSDDVFHQGAMGLSMLTAAIGIGAIVGGTVLANRSGLEGLTERMIWMLLLLSISVIGFTATDIFPVALVCALIAGYCAVTIGVTEQTLLQASVDNDMRGRVMSFYVLIARGCPAFGALFMGYLATHFGLRLPVAGGAVICIGIWFWAHCRRKRLAAILERSQPS